MSTLYQIGLQPPSCNGCELKKLKYQLGEKFLLLPTGIYELDAQPAQGQGQPLQHEGRRIKFIIWEMSYELSNECYNWKPPK